MNKQEIMTHIREELTEKENAVFDSMLNGDTVPETAEKLGISYEFARSYRKTVYEVVGIYADLGNTNRNKQLRLIDLFSDNKTVVTITAGEQPQPVTIKAGETVAPVTVTTEPIKPNFLVLNPYKHCPNKIYKSYERALEDAKTVAKKEQQKTYVLRIETVITPHCSFDVEDVSKTGIKDTHFVHNFF